MSIVPAESSKFWLSVEIFGKAGSPDKIPDEELKSIILENPAGLLDEKALLILLRKISGSDK